MIDKKVTQDELTKSLDNINGWIIAYDNKASILLAFVTLLIGLTTDIFKIFSIIKDCITDQSIERIFLMVLLIIMLCIYAILITCIVFFLINVLKAQKDSSKLSKDLTNIRKSTIFSSSIASMTLEEYKSCIMNKNEEILLEELQEQIYINSKITERKHCYFNRAIKLIMPLFVLVILLLMMVNIF